MAIKVIIELQAKPGQRAELKSLLQSVPGTVGPSLAGFLGSTCYEVLDNPAILVEITDWESAEARAAAMQQAMDSGAYAPLADLIISFVIAGVFILSTDRIPLLRRYAIAGALLYGFGAFIVMNLIVVPLSAAPPLPAPTTLWLIEAIVEHILAIGLPLGILVRRNANTNKAFSQ